MNTYNSVHYDLPHKTMHIQSHNITVASSCPPLTPLAHVKHPNMMSPITFSCGLTYQTRRNTSSQNCTLQDQEQHTETYYHVTWPKNTTWCYSHLSNIRPPAVTSSNLPFYYPTLSLPLLSWTSCKRLTCAKQTGYKIHPDFVYSTIL
jgi:hypothetical protein